MIRDPRFIAIDTESELIEPGVLAPRLASLQLYERGTKPRAVNHWQAIREFRKFASQRGTVFVAHNIAFDMGMLSEHCTRSEGPEEGLRFLRMIFRLYRQGRIVCTDIRERLLSIAKGDYKFRYERKQFSLGVLAELYFNKKLSKGEDSWRYRYGELLDVPIREWPHEALKYALDDVRTHLRLFEYQAKHVDGWHVSLDEARQTRAAFALHLIGAWGVRVDEPRVLELEKRLTIAKHSAIMSLAKHKLYKAGTGKRRYELSKIEEALRTGRPKVSQDTNETKARVIRAYKARGMEPPLTESEKNISTNADTLLNSGDPILVELSETQSETQALSGFIPSLKRGFGGIPVCARYNALTDNGRTSCSDPNLQNQPARTAGVRECWVPRKGNVFFQADWSGAELCSLAEVCYELIGFSELGEFIKRGGPSAPHIATFAKLRGVSFEQAAKMKATSHPQWKRDNKLVKAANFGYPGGLGAFSFIGYARSFDPANPIRLTEARSQEIRNAWLETYPEMTAYFEFISELTSDFGPGYLEHLYSGRILGAPTYCQGANAFFSGLVADGAKDAMFDIVEACFVREDHALFGARLNAFVHDEFIGECEEERGHECAEALSEMMVEAMARWIKRVPVKAEPSLMRRWWKSAETVRDKRGRLIPWEPNNAKEETPKTRRRARTVRHSKRTPIPRRHS